MKMKTIANICVLMLTTLVALQSENVTPIDRHALVTRHNITWNDPAKHLPLGNGEFSFGADGTGLQTFAGNSMSHWGWHSFPLPDGWTADRVPSTGTFQKGRNTGPDNTYPIGTDAIRSWMSINPHIMNLGRLRLMRSDGRVLTPGEVTGLKRSLDLWSGVQTSQYLIDGNEVNVETCVHPGLDMVAVRIESPLVERGELEVALDFAYPSMNNGAWVGDFNRTTGHSTVGTRQGDRRVDLVRKVDAVTYHAALMAGEGGAIRLPSKAGAPQQTHDVWTVSARGSKTLSFVCAYSAVPLPRVLPSGAETKTASAVRWETFWKSGGAIDLSGSSDARWKELERRIVLSQYLMAAMSAGSWPSSENGLVGIDPWHGRFHMEMVWWHLAHYALWDRWEMADKALGCYQRFTPAARDLAAQLGYKGLKWGKSVGPDGRTAPWDGNQVLLWKEPHPIFFAELDYRLHPTRATLEKWADIVQGTAENMADYPTKDEKTGIYHLAFVMPPSERGHHQRYRIRSGVLALGAGQGSGMAAAHGAGAGAAMGPGAPQSGAVAGGQWPLHPYGRVERYVHQTRLGASRSDWSPWHAAAHRRRGCPDCQTHRQRGLDDLGLEPLLGLGFPMDRNGCGAHPPAADRGGCPAERLCEEQLFDGWNVRRLVPAWQRRPSLRGGDDGRRMGWGARAKCTRFSQRWKMDCALGRS